MIDTKELRRLAQEATPHVGHACKYQDAHWLREGHVDFENADLFIASERPQEDADFYAAANPTAISELLDRLEAAEKSDAESIAMYRKARDERDDLRAALQHEADCVEACKSEIEGLRAENAGLVDDMNLLRDRIEEMEKQEPVWFIDERGEPKRYHKSKADYCKYGGLDLLYALPCAKGE